MPVPTPAPAGDDPTPVRVSLPRAVWAVLAVVALVPLLALALLLAGIEDQRRTIRDQRALTDQLLRTAAASRQDASPFLRDAPQLVDDLTAALPQARATARRVDRLSRAATPLAQALDRADPEGLSAALTGVSDALLTQDRLQRFLVRATSTFGDVRDHDLVGRSARATADVRRLLRTQRDAAADLRSSLQVQRQTLDLVRQTLEVARDTGAHAASLDRKLGGQVPPAGR